MATAAAKLIQSYLVYRLLGALNKERRAALVVIAAMALELIAIFSDGGYFIDAMTLCVIGLWLLAGAAVFNEESLSLKSIQIALPLSLLTALWLWTGISIFWSIATDLTWIEFNRTGGYLATFIIGLTVGRYRLARRLTLYLFLLVCTAAALYALGPKAAPSLVDNLNNMARISVPVGYANGIGLLLALPVPLALYAVTSRNINAVSRVLSAATIPLLLVALFFTLSRGATYALIAGMIAYFLVSPSRQRSFYVLLLTLTPVFLITRWSNNQPAFMAERVDLLDKFVPAAYLRIYILTALTTVVLLIGALLYLGKRASLPKKLIKVSGIAILSLTIAATILASSLFVSSKPSMGQWVAQKYEEFTIYNAKGKGAERLFSFRDSVRYMLWREAVSNWQEKPWSGTGAQSFPLVHLMKRDEGIPFVKQVHGLFLSWLTEMGIIGLFLGISFVGTSLGVALFLIVKLNERWERGLAAAFISSIIIYLIGTNFDWDWNLFAVTLPYFLFAGIISGWSNHSV